MSETSKHMEVIIYYTRCRLSLRLKIDVILKTLIPLVAYLSNSVFWNFASVSTFIVC